MEHNTNSRVNRNMKKRKRPKGLIPLLISGIIGLIYLIYIISYFSGQNGAASTDTDVIAAAIASALIMPHIICVGVAVLMNWLGIFLKKHGFALTGAILYTVSAALFPIYFMFVIVEAILSFIAYAKMKSNRYRR